MIIGAASNVHFCLEKRPTAMKRMLMSKTAALMIAWSAAIISVSAQSSEKPGSDPRKVIEQFCKMDLAGRLLTHEGVEETAKLLVTPYRWSQNQEIVVVNNYVVRGPSKQSRRASITVDYRVWGEISPSLRFVRQEGVIADSPVMIHEYMDSVLTNRYNE